MPPFCREHIGLCFGCWFNVITQEVHLLGDQSFGRFHSRHLPKKIDGKTIIVFAYNFPFKVCSFYLCDKKQSLPETV
jgi:hypothetical protein